MILQKWFFSFCFVCMILNVTGTLKNCNPHNKEQKLCNDIIVFSLINSLVL